MREPHPCSTLPTRNLFPQRLASVVCLQSTALGQGLGRSTFNVAYSVVGGRDIPSRSRIVRAAWRLDGPRTRSSFSIGSIHTGQISSSSARFFGSTRETDFEAMCSSGHFWASSFGRSKHSV